MGIPIMEGPSKSPNRTQLAESQPPTTPHTRPMTPAPFSVLLLLKVGVARGGAVPYVRALGARAMGLDRLGGPPGRVGSGPGCVG